MLSFKQLTALICVSIWAAECSPNPPIYKGCDIPGNVREGVNRPQDRCAKEGFCWGPGGGFPDCYKPHNDTSIKVYIHLMPWFETKESNTDPDRIGKWGQHWSMVKMNPDIKDSSGRRQIASKQYPLIDLYDSGDPHVIDWQLGLMKLSGVTGVLIDWPGTAKVFDYVGNFENCEAIVKGCERVGLEYAIVYEDHNLGMARDAHLLNVSIVEQGKADIRYLMDKHFANKNYIQMKGAPLILDFGPQTLSAGDWDQVYSVDPKPPIFMTLWGQMKQGGKTARGEFAWVYSNYLEGLRNFYHFANDIDFKFGVAYPGFDSAYTMGGWPGPTWTIPVSVDTFEQTFDLVRAFGINQVQVATWNDYGEGTNIEPTREHQYEFLKVLQHRLELKYTEEDLKKVTDNYLHRKLHANNQTMLDILERQYFHIINS